ncbi:MAG: hypothetical protein RXR51_08920 [Nitrososphaeria archaeon]
MGHIWDEILNEFKKRKNQYNHVEVKGIIYFVDGPYLEEHPYLDEPWNNVGWKNVVTMFYPKPDPVHNKPITYNYGDIIIFSRNIDAEKAIEVFTKLREEKKISLPELKEYYVTERRGRSLNDDWDFWEFHRGDFYSNKELKLLGIVLGSYKELNGFILEWPSIVYYRDEHISLSVSYGPLISPDLPLYPSLKHAIEKEFGGDANAWFNKLVIILPDYRARIKKLTLSPKNKIKVELEVKHENLENLLCKCYCISEKGKIYQNDIRFKNLEEELTFEDEIKEFYFYLITKQGEIIDYKEGKYEES